METNLADLKARNPWRKAKLRDRTPKVNYAFNPSCSANGTPMSREELAKRGRARGAPRRTLVKCVETDEIFDSMGAASEALGLHANALAKAFCYAKKHNREVAIAGGRQWIRV